MVRFFIVLALAGALVGMAILEQHFIQGAYGRLERDTEALIASVMADEDKEAFIATEANIALVNHMYDYWLVYEKRLSMLARHFDLAQVSDALIYAKNFIVFDNKEEAMAGLLRLRYLIKTHSFNVGTSIQNVI